MARNITIKETGTTEDGKYFVVTEEGGYPNAFCTRYEEGKNLDKIPWEVKKQLRRLDEKNESLVPTKTKKK